MDSRPLFQVGEEVILQSSTHPQFNGEYIVESVIGKNQTFECRVSGGIYYSDNSGFSYRMEAPFIISEFKCEGLCWESELRKKHKGIDQSLEDMIKEINRGVKA